MRARSTENNRTVQAVQIERELVVLSVDAHNALFDRRNAAKYCQARFRVHCAVLDVFFVVAVRHDVRRKETARQKNDDEEQKQNTAHTAHAPSATNARAMLAVAAAANLFAKSMLQ